MSNLKVAISTRPFFCSRSGSGIAGHDILARHGWEKRKA